jgi:triacylglycerol lipase
MRGENSIWRAVFACLFLAWLPAKALAQANSPDIMAHIAALGRGTDPKTVAATKDIYRALQPKPPFTHVRVHRNIPYGPDAQNRLDVFVPEPLPSDAIAVLVFVHGGTFTGGDKSDGTFYDNVGRWAAKHNLIGININYRLAPGAPWPAAIEDIGLAVHWAIQNVAPFGGDPDRIFLMGHSSGATHVAGYLSHPDLQPPFGAGVAGGILVSGVYNFTANTLTDNEKKYFGSDSKLYAEQSALQSLAQSKLPLLIAVGGLDTPRAERQADLLNKAACAKQNCPRFVVLPKHSHMSEIFAINTGGQELTRAISGFIKSH